VSKALSIFTIDQPLFVRPCCRSGEDFLLYPPQALKRRRPCRLRVTASNAVAPAVAPKASYAARIADRTRHRPAARRLTSLTPGRSGCGHGQKSLRPEFDVAVNSSGGWLDRTGKCFMSNAPKLKNKRRRGYGG
jgi:hypothetical protein